MLIKMTVYGWSVFLALLLGYFSSAVFCSRIQDHKTSNVGIVGGHTITIKQAPYIASIRLQNGTYHFCGGSIIHDQFVLTAAHCVTPPYEHYSVVVGTDDLNKGGTLYDVSKIIPHEKFTDKSSDYDICLMKLATPLKFETKVQKIALPEKDIRLKRKTMVLATGWGSTGPNGTDVSNHLLQVSIPVISAKSCQKVYAKDLIWISPRMLCAGAYGKDSCQGDSGGPLTLDGVQYGVTSFGKTCGVDPGVYTKVASYRAWIQENIAGNL